MVQLRAVTSHGIVTLVGVAVAEGGLVATTADGLSGLHSLDMIGTDGRLLQASVVAIDHASDIALVSVPDDVPVAPFADDAALDNGSADMTLSMAAPTDGTVALHCEAGIGDRHRHRHRHRTGQGHARHHVDRRLDRRPRAGRPAAEPARAR